VQLLFDPFDLTEIEVRYQGRPMGKAIPQRISRHTHPQARQLTELPAKPSGIDYLALVAARVARDEGARITYVNLAQPHQPQDPDGIAVEENIP
jgi:putative transposase